MTLYKENGKYVSDGRVKNMSDAEKKGLERFHKLKKYYVFNMMDTEGVESLIMKSGVGNRSENFRKMIKF